MIYLSRALNTASIADPINGGEEHYYGYHGKYAIPNIPLERYYGDKRVRKKYDKVLSDLADPKN